MGRRQVPISAETKALVVLLRTSYRKPLSYRQIGKRCNISKSEVHRLCNSTKSKSRGQLENGKGGRPRKLDKRGIRSLIRTIRKLRTKNVNFTIKQLAEASGISHLASRRTISRYLNEQGYKFLQTRKKGLLTAKDRRLRLQYARRMKRKVKESPEFWTKDVAFYLDGVSFVYKTNPLSKATEPKARVWRRKSEGLTVTAKGSKDLAGGKRLHVLVAISFKKGVILHEVYETMNGKFFASFVKEHFPACFARAGSNRRRLFVMDNDPSQVSKAAQLALKEIGAELHHIPPRSPCINPIESIFHIVKKMLEDEAIRLQIVRESFNDFKSRVIRCFDSVDPELIDRTIKSMPKRIEQIIAAKGGRIKF